MLLSTNVKAMSTEIKLEVCVDSLASALAAEEGGASRIELCSALSEGGLTPSIGTLKTLKELPITIPIYCMLRPRRGNDFIYSDLELKAILTDLELLREHGADGFVFGALKADRTIDIDKCQQVLQKAESLPVTFHRAFDLTDPNFMHENVVRLMEIGFKRLLSSGFRQTAHEGIEFLAQLIAKHHHAFTIMPGSGVNVSNLEEILTVTRCVEFHASATSLSGEQQLSVVDGSNVTCQNMECDVTMGKQDSEPYSITNANVVRKMVTIGNAIMGSK